MSKKFYIPIILVVAIIIIVGVVLATQSTQNQPEQQNRPENQANPQVETQNQENQGNTEIGDDSQKQDENQTKDDINENELIPISNEDPIVITSSVDTSDWLTYRNEELGISFQNPDNFYLLDRISEKENAILMSDEKISFNEFLNGYFAPVDIRRSSQEQDSDYIDTLINIQEETKIIDGETAKIIRGVFPEQPPYHEFNTLVIVFEDRDVIITINDVRSFAGGKVSFDINQVAEDLLESIEWTESPVSVEWLIYRDTNYGLELQYIMVWEI